MARSLGSLLFFCVVLMLGVACSSDEDAPVPVENSTYRIGVPEPDPASDVKLHIFRDRDACIGASVDDEDACVPYVDRQKGETHLSFQIRDKTSEAPFPQPLEVDQVKVFHDNRGMENVELIQHQKAGSSQLFVVLIDGSSSMFDNDGEAVKKVYNALMRASVVNSFFPGEGSKTGVVLMRFMSGDPVGLDGGPPKILRNKSDYKKAVRDNLMRRTGGFTHLYNAARFAVTKLLREPEIEQFLASNTAEPTIILITDGFNNEASSDLCETNVSRLQETLDVIRGARSSRDGGNYRPRVFTVGLGAAYRPGNKPKGQSVDVTPSGLCGKFVYNKINGGLETAGIDHVSLAWMAEAGAGISFVKRNADGLAKVFASASAESYRWFEVRYRVPDVILHRKSFDIRVELESGYRSKSTVSVYPGAWMDMPPAPILSKPGEPAITPLRSTMTLVMPILGFLVTVAFTGPAAFNARRAVFRRARPRAAASVATAENPDPGSDGGPEEAPSGEPPSSA